VIGKCSCATSAGNTTTLVASGADGPSISAHGRYVAFDGTTSGSRPFLAVLQVLVRGLRTNRTVLVSRARGPRGAAGNGDSGDSVPISADGRRVAFLSRATDLTPDDANAGVFLRELNPLGDGEAPDRANCEADDGSRTRDLRLGKQPSGR